MEKIESLANKARDSLGKYCFSECSAYCCRKGYIILEENEVDLMVKDKKELLLKEGSLKELPSKKFSLCFDNSLEGCPNLINSKCSIHNNSNRPLACHEFPIFITGKKIRISPRCFGAKAGLLFPFIHEAKELGYEIEGID